jgi:hypothetical protein
MHRLSTLLLFLLVGACTFAQTANHNYPTAASDQEQVFEAPARHLSIGCPVGFAANRQGTAQVMSAGDAKQTGSTLGLHLMLDHLNEPAIESIEVTVYGMSPKEGVLPVEHRSADTVIKTFELHRVTGSTSLNDADVWMHQVGSLSWVDLTAITYTDGTTWHSTENFKCRVVPSNFILVGRK